MKTQETNFSLDAINPVRFQELTKAYHDLKAHILKDHLDIVDRILPYALTEFNYDPFNRYPLLGTPKIKLDYEAPCADPFLIQTTHPYQRAQLKRFAWQWSHNRN